MLHYANADCYVWPEKEDVGDCTFKQLWHKADICHILWLLQYYSHLLLMERAQPVGRRAWPEQLYTQTVRMAFAGCSLNSEQCGLQLWTLIMDSCNVDSDQVCNHQCLDRGDYEVAYAQISPNLSCTLSFSSTAQSLSLNSKDFK